MSAVAASLEVQSVRRGQDRRYVATAAALFLLDGKRLCVYSACCGADSWRGPMDYEGPPRARCLRCGELTSLRLLESFDWWWSEAREGLSALLGLPPLEGLLETADFFAAVEELLTGGGAEEWQAL